ncbi:N-acetylmuramoyl-L-alanine amidase [Candidatus Dependentiae bacterium]|nr:N-acetylmuramoyl-L-alanine amidase [Candidatus Dependentiae bacterium]
MQKKIIILMVFVLCFSFYINAADDLKNIVICIDAGHGGTDPGAKGIQGLKEAETVLKIAKLVQSKLESKGAVVEMTRETDSVMSLSARTNLANAVKADRLLSIHLNAFNTKANYTLTTVYLTAQPSSNSTKIAAFIAKDINTEIGLGFASSNFSPAISGVRKENFHMLRESSMPAVLTESSFIDYPAEEIKLTDPKYIEKVAQIIFTGICKHYGVQPEIQTVQKSSLNITVADKTDNAKVLENVTVSAIFSGGGVIELLTDKTGKVLFTGLVPGKISVRIKHQNYKEALFENVELKSGQTTTLNLFAEERTGSIIGIITDAKTGTRLVNVKCSLIFNNSVVKTGNTGATGVYKFESVKCGDYSVKAEFDGYAAAIQTIQVSADLEKWNSIKLNQDIKIKSEISGIVKDAVTGEAISGAKMTLYKGTVSTNSVYSGVDGSYVFKNLDNATYKIQCKPKSIYKTKTISSIKLGENETKQTDFILMNPETPGSINGYVYRIKNNRKVAVMSEEIKIYKAGKMEAVCQTGWGATAGMFRVDNLKAGKYDIHVAGTIKTSTVSAGKTVNPSIKIE